MKNDDLLFPEDILKELKSARERGQVVAVQVHGTYKPYTGRVLLVSSRSVSLVNEYSSQVILLADIIAVRRYT